MSLDFHPITTVLAMVRDLDESVEVVVRSRWIGGSRAAPRRAIDVLLSCHAAIRRNCQAKVVATFGLLVFVSASDIPANRRLSDLRLQQLLILFVLLSVLLEELS